MITTAHQPSVLDVENRNVLTVMDFVTECAFHANVIHANCQAIGSVIVVQSGVTAVNSKKFVRIVVGKPVKNHVELALKFAKLVKLLDHVFFGDIV